MTIVVLKNGPNSDQINLLNETVTPTQEIIEISEVDNEIVEDGESLDDVIIDDSERTCDLENL